MLGGEGALLQCAVDGLVCLALDVGGGDGEVLCVVAVLLGVDEREGEEDEGGADDVPHGDDLVLEEDVAGHSEGDGEAEADSHGEWAGEQDGLGPAVVAGEGDDAVGEEQVDHGAGLW